MPSGSFAKTKSCRLVIGVLLLFGSVAAHAAPIADDEREFFENKIRPVLVEHCYECHNSADVSEGGLSLDWRDALRKGGNSGPALVSGQPDKSLLIRVLHHDEPDMQMPQGGEKLPASVIADFERWVEKGAPDPRDQPPSAKQLAEANSWETLLARRRQWWCFQPVQAYPVPEVGDNTWSQHPVDRFLLLKMFDNKLSPVGDADRATLIRRLTFVLHGLPPTRMEIEDFVNDPSENTYGELVDRLLDSPRFGERWARHWMDWLRYAETNGSEGDPAIPHAWRYRDYLIRSLNQDVPYNQLVLEHIAGDLLAEPRVNRDLNLNESALGLAHLRMVQHGFQPTDALDELVRFTDDQINVVSKAFQALTISCARCHDHKFDAISQADFHGLYSTFVSSLPATIIVDAPGQRTEILKQLDDQKKQIREILANHWLKSVGSLAENLAGAVNGRDSDEINRIVELIRSDANSPFAVLLELREQKEPEQIRETWNRRASQFSSAEPAPPKQAGWDLRGGDYLQWSKTGPAWPSKPHAPGSFNIGLTGSKIVTSVYPRGAYSHLASSKQGGILTSPTFKIDTDRISVRVLGSDFAQARLVVQNFPIPRGGIYGMKAQPLHEDFRWYTWDSTYWKGEQAYIEVATFDDLTFFEPHGNPGKSPEAGDGRSAIGIAQVVFHNADESPRAVDSPAASALFGGAEKVSPTDKAAMIVRVATAIEQSIRNWRQGTVSDAEANLLGYLVKNDLLANSLESVPEAAPLVTAYRQLEGQLPVSTRAPGVIESHGIDYPLFVRGNHRQPSDPVPRKYLEVLGGQPYDTKSSGRLELAQQVASADNPLTARVAVNRLWHHVFGQGIVATPDNFGRLGEKPTHPELLDYLANHFVQNGWSIKDTVRLLVTTRAFRLASDSHAAQSIDPLNKLLSHWTIRRIEAECVRDSLLAVTGELDPSMYGVPVPGDSNRRSVYVAIRRNSLDPLLHVFDAPEPFATTGRRDATNVPAQSLTMLNDPFIHGLAGRWMTRFPKQDLDSNPREVVNSLFWSLFGRAPVEEEFQASQALLNQLAGQRHEAATKAELAAKQKAKLAEEIAGILRPAREQLMARKVNTPPEESLAKPIAAWEFTTGLRDTIGDLHGNPVGQVSVTAEGVTVTGQGYVATAPGKVGLSEKTLEAWVILGNRSQRGGGVMSVQSLDGGIFDAIVFGEQTPGHWLAGSDHFRRTQPLGGMEENDAINRPVHLVITYHADGTITAYRDGTLYGKPYKSGGPVRHGLGQWIVTFGLRHLPAGGNRGLEGTILKARLYDRALSPKEVAHSAGVELPVTRDALLALLTHKQREKLEQIEVTLRMVEQEHNKLSTIAAETRNEDWRRLVVALFNLKEFLYLR